MEESEQQLKQGRMEIENNLMEQMR